MAEKNQRGAKVERFRLSKEQLSFQKSFSRLKEVEQMLQQKQLMVQKEVESMQEMWQMLSEGYKALGIIAPKKPIVEFGDMNFREEPEGQGGQGLGSMGPGRGQGPIGPAPPGAPMIEY